MKILGMSLSAFLVASGLVFGSTAAATATVDECVPVEAVDAWTETIPAVTNLVEHPAEYKTVEVSPAVEYKPAVYELEYEFRHKFDGKKTKWSTNPNWNAESNDNSKGWYATGNTRNGKLISEEVLAKDAVTEQQLVKEAWTETVEVTPEQKIEHPAVEAVTCEDEEEPPVVTPVTKTLKWTLPKGGTPENVTWPQTVFDAQTIPCGETVWVQVDVYPYTTDEDKARTDALDDDGVLTQGEDYGWAKSWTFETYTGPDCHVPPTPAPVVFTDFTCDTDASIDITETEGVAYLISIDGSDPVHIGDMTIPLSAKENVVGKNIMITASDTVTGETLAEYPFTFTDPGSCEVPPTAANPTATVTAICGSATLILTNPLVNDANQITASFVVNVDGEFYGAYSAQAGARVEEVIEFGEDTGTHLVEVFQAGTSEWKLIASGEVSSDCEVPPTTPEEPEEPTTPTEPEEPTTPEQPKPEEPAHTIIKVNATPVEASVVTDGLAQTGSDGNEGLLWTLGGVMMLLAGGALVITRRFVANK